MDSDKRGLDESKKSSCKKIRIQLFPRDSLTKLVLDGWEARVRQRQRPEKRQRKQSKNTESKWQRFFDWIYDLFDFLDGKLN